MKHEMTLDTQPDLKPDLKPGLKFGLKIGLKVSRAFAASIAIACIFVSIPSSHAQEATPVEMKFHFRGGGCFDENHTKGRNETAMVECGFLKGRVQFGLIGVSLLGFWGQFLNIYDLVFIKVNFANTRLELAKVEKTRFDEVEISNADWRGVQMRSVNFNRSTFRQVDLRGAKLSEVVFNDCDLADINLEGATLFRVSFKNSKTSNLKMNLVSKNLVSGI